VLCVEQLYVVLLWLILLNEGTIQCGWVCDVRIGMTDVSVLVDDCEVFVTNM